MASSNKTINAFTLAVLLQKASKNPETLANEIDLTRLTRLINAHFSTEVANAGVAIAERS